MGNIIELSKLVQSTLNTYATDLFPANNTRKGTQFLLESDAINLNRRDSYPKGYVKPASQTNADAKSKLGRSGWIKKYATLDIYYYSKQDTKKTINSIQYKNQELVSYMMNEIQTVLLNNRFADYYLGENAFGIAQEPIPTTQGSYKLYYGVVPVTFYWYEKYG